MTSKRAKTGLHTDEVDYVKHVLIQWASTAHTCPNQHYEIGHFVQWGMCKDTGSAVFYVLKWDAIFLHLLLADFRAEFLNKFVRASCSEFRRSGIQMYKQSGLDKLS